MDIKAIKDVVNADMLADEMKEKFIISIIAHDKKVIPTILSILDNERKMKDELISDSNYELSRALMVLQDKKIKYPKKIIADPKWVVGEIIKHYLKWKDVIKCNFKIDELP